MQLVRSGSVPLRKPLLHGRDTFSSPNVLGTGPVSAYQALVWYPSRHQAGIVSMSSPQNDSSSAELVKNRILETQM